MSIRATLRRLLLWGLALWVLRALDDATSFGKTWLFPLLPSAILSLSVDHFRALGATFLASLAAWAIGAAGGYVIALLVGSARLGAQVPQRRFHFSLSEHFDRFFDWLYVIPLVLTLSMSYAVAMKLFLDYGMPKWLVSTAMVSVTGLALAGYTVYKCVITAVVYARDEHLFLAESLCIPGRASRVLRRANVPFVQVRRLRDFDIGVFAEALRRAFHLAVVSVVILETVTPAFYELVLPQGGVDKPWLGGVGRVVLRAQQTSNFELIAGCIWCVLFFDWIVVSMIDAALWRRWLRFQRKGVRA